MGPTLREEVSALQRRLANGSLTVAVVPNNASRERASTPPTPFPLNSSPDRLALAAEKMRLGFSEQNNDDDDGIKSEINSFVSSATREEVMLLVQKVIQLKKQVSDGRNALKTQEHQSRQKVEVMGAAVSKARGVAMAAANAASRLEDENKELRSRVRHAEALVTSVMEKNVKLSSETERLEGAVAKLVEDHTRENDERLQERAKLVAMCKELHRRCRSRSPSSTTTRTRSPPLRSRRSPSPAREYTSDGSPAAPSTPLRGKRKADDEAWITDEEIGRSPPMKENAIHGRGNSMWGKSIGENGIAAGSSANRLASTSPLPPRKRARFFASSGPGRLLLAGAGAGAGAVLLPPQARRAVVATPCGELEATVPSSPASACAVPVG